jgi:TolB-like protein/DNA-binding CsgD family transcriptional regulator
MRELTLRQLEILKLMARGLSNKEIGRELDIALGTVRKHVSAVIDALEVSNRTEAAVALRELSHGAAPLDDVRSAAERAQRPAIAVLPFDDLSADPEPSGLADGIVEDLITSLSRWHWFPVIARNSTFAYRGRAVDAKRVNRELGARYAVEGSLRRAGRRLRVNVQLVDATTSEQVWAQTYDREVVDPFALPDELAETLVTAIEPALQRAERRKAATGSPERLDAWSTMQRGLSFVFAQTREDLRTGRALIERACELDPTFAAAFSSLAFASGIELAHGWSPAPAETIARGLRAASRAVEIDPEDAFAQALLAGALCASGERRLGLAHFERAAALNPSLPAAQHGLGVECRHLGRLDAAVFHLERAIRLSPHDLMLHAFHAAIASVDLMRRDFERAIERAARSVEVKSDAAQPHGILAAAHAELGQIDAARAAHARLLELSPALSRAYLRIFDPEPLIEIYALAWRRIGYELPDARATCRT